MNQKKIITIIFLIASFLACIVAYKIAHRYFNRPPKIIQAPKVVITIPEGLKNEQIADKIAQKLPLFNKEVFLNDKNNTQGYLFPDTYFFTDKTNTEEVSKTLKNNFDKKIKEIENQIQQSGESLDSILTMASILEEEANGQNDIYIISGILWKRMKIGLPLQVDAAPITYKEKGLPDSPISNPGLLSINAALKPQASSYLYYLHEKTGQVHYARNYNEHLRNIKIYLK